MHIYLENQRVNLWFVQMENKTIEWRKKIPFYGAMFIHIQIKCVDVAGYFLKKQPEKEINQNYKEGEIERASERIPVSAH